MYVLGLALIAWKKISKSEVEKQDKAEREEVDVHKFLINIFWLYMRKRIMALTSTHRFK